MKNEEFYVVGSISEKIMNKAQDGSFTHKGWNRYFAENGTTKYGLLFNVLWDVAEEIKT